jgi:hypothetical protein
MSRFSGEGGGSDLGSPRGLPVARFVLPTLLAVLVSFAVFAAGSSGCVAPIAPDFQNPPLAPNYPPSFEQFDPYQETPVSQLPQDFAVRLNDPNPQDTLYVRWALDYPPYIQSKSLLVVNGQALPPGGMASYRVESCDIFKQSPPHQLVIIVSDRPFQKAETFLGTDRYNRTEGSDPPIMAGWVMDACNH